MAYRPAAARPDNTTYRSPGVLPGRPGPSGAACGRVSNRRGSFSSHLAFGCRHGGPSAPSAASQGATGRSSQTSGHRRGTGCGRMRSRGTGRPPVHRPARPTQAGQRRCCPAARPSGCSLRAAGPARITWPWALIGGGAARPCPRTLVASSGRSRPGVVVRPRAGPAAGSPARPVPSRARPGAATAFEELAEVRVAAPPLVDAATTEFVALAGHLAVGSKSWPSPGAAPTSS